jgi:hypothetical protein
VIIGWWRSCWAVCARSSVAASPACGWPGLCRRRLVRAVVDGVAVAVGQGGFGKQGKS